MTVSFPRTDRTRSSKHLDESFDDCTVVDRVLERARSIRVVAHSSRPPRDTVFGIPTTPILAWADLGFVDPRRTKARVYAYTCIDGWNERNRISGYVHIRFLTFVYVCCWCVGLWWCDHTGGLEWLKFTDIVTGWSTVSGPVSDMKFRWGLNREASTVNGT